MDNKDIKMLRLIFNKATSDGERLNAINFIIKRYGKETVDQILNNRPIYNFTSNDYKYFIALGEENIRLKIDNEKLSADLYHAKFCAVFWFMLMIIMGIVFIIL